MVFFLVTSPPHSPIFLVGAAGLSDRRGPGPPLWLNDVSQGISVSLDRTRRRNGKVLMGVKSQDGSGRPGSLGEMGEGTDMSWLANLSSLNQRQDLQLLWPSLSDLYSPEYCLLPGHALWAVQKVSAIWCCWVAHRLQQYCGWDLKVLLNSG